MLRVTDYSRYLTQITCYKVSREIKNNKLRVFELLRLNQVYYKLLFVAYL